MRSLAIEMNPPRPRFSTHVVWTLATRIMMMASGVGSSIIVARWLGAEGYGTLAVLNMIVAVVVQIGSAGLPSANTYYIARDKSLLAPVWANALAFATVAGMLLAVAVIGLAKARPDLLGNIPLELVAIAALSIPLQSITLLGLNVMLGLGRIAHFNVLDAATQMLMLLNAVFALVVFGTELRTLVSLNVIVTMLVSFVVIRMIGREMKKSSGDKRLRPDAALFKETARYGIKFHIATLAGLIIFRADLLIVNHFRGVTEAGVYAVATQVAGMLMVLPGIIGTLIFPRIASSNVDERGEYAMRGTRHTAFIMLLIFAAVTPLIFLLPVFYGPSFADAPTLLLILLPGVYLLGVEAVLVQYFNSTGMPVAIPLFWLVTFVANVTLNLIFVPTYGARAAAVSSSISYALIFVLVAVYFRIKTGNRFSDVMLLRADEFRQIFAFKA